MARTITPEMIDVAAKAYRAGGDIHYGHRFDARMDWTKQGVVLTDEIGDIFIDFRNPAFMAASGSN